ncbi:hypothetical protein [Tropicimonas aquimaris]|uniref:HEPN AbiU2-like domain-containing protein n=1 Tax=Tropicimonas aquimaris TaxID=914152 RepID=A0ABW3IR64_9RHOB
MSSNEKNKAYRPPELYSDQYYEIYDRLVPVLNEHFKRCENFKAKEHAYHFLGDYYHIRMNLWSRERSSKALGDLRRAIVELIKAYENTPIPVRKELALNHEDIREEARNEFLKQHDRQVILPGAFDLPDVSKATSALKVLYEERKGLLLTIDKTQGALPEGFATRNRPLKEWALIEVSVRLVREFDAMNVPHEIDRSGPMYRLLKDVFEVFGIRKDSLQGVYRGWREHMDGKFDIDDLLTI